ncbi:MAG: alpha/beta hydrolase [Yoonia sp.]|nr:alpha/beta hydrolase [Yoonia sp.]
MSYTAKRTRGDDASTHVFTCHGTGGSETQFHGFAEKMFPDAHVTSPRGDVSEGGALRYFRRMAEGLYDMDDLALRRAAMASFVRKEAAGATRVIALGYSNGANIAAAVALHDADIFTDLVLLHPLIPWAPAPQPALRGKRVLITAGERDPICPKQQTQALADYLTAQGADVTLKWHAGGHEIAQSEVAAISAFFS